MSRVSWNNRQRKSYASGAKYKKDVWTWDLIVRSSKRNDILSDLKDTVYDLSQIEKD